jgi:molybdenum cofactor biosynthesis enzyme
VPHSGAAVRPRRLPKAVDRGMTITDVGFVSKTGGKSGTWQRAPQY